MKWGTIAYLAKEYSISRVLHVALYPSDRSIFHLSIDDSTDRPELPMEVICHFRDIDQIDRLAEKLQLRIEIHKDEFRWTPDFRTRDEFRASYFDGVAKRIVRCGEGRIVFLDPDTGIAPEICGYEHVTCEEISAIFNALVPESILAPYQHARLGDCGWLGATRREFERAIGASVGVRTITCNEIANDVAFFVAQKSVAGLRE